MLVWALESYNDVSPLILSGAKCDLAFEHLIICAVSVGEEEEISIRDLVHLIADSSGFTGDIVVHFDYL